MSTVASVAESIGVREISWGHGSLSLTIRAGNDAAPALTQLNGFALDDRAAGIPLVEIIEGSEGRTWSGSRVIDTAVGQELRYLDHRSHSVGNRHELEVRMYAPGSQLEVSTVLRSREGSTSVRALARVTNRGLAPLRLVSVSTLSLALDIDMEDAELYWFDNGWLSEAQHKSSPLRRLLPDLSLEAHGKPPRGSFSRRGAGGWPTGEHLPTGILLDSVSNRSLVWQVEGGAPWSWEVGERIGGAYLSLSGPNGVQHSWVHLLEPGSTFETVPATLAAAEGSVDAAVSALTAARRELLPESAPDSCLPVIYNDYMNTVMGDPTTEKLLPLVKAAAEMGAEYFCIDAGWYDDSNGDWWPSVGEWKPASSRFPNGLGEVTAAIRAHGLVPGLWLEPEVMGVDSPAAGDIPAEGFFRIGGARAREHDRYHLDFDHPQVRDRLDTIVDGLVADFGIGYLKLDYNINLAWPSDGESADSVLLRHARAYQGWLRSLRERHPTLILENCASGGLRMDYGVLAETHLQSMTDQQDFRRLAAVAAGASLAVAPEQAGIWAYPHATQSVDEIVFTMTSALLGRVVLSGWLNRLSEQQQYLVSSAVAVYKSFRSELKTATSFWPLGLPRWEDEWLSVGAETPDRLLLSVWRRGGAESAFIPLPGVTPEARLLFPPRDATAATWTSCAGGLELRLPAAPSAILIEIPKGSVSADG